MLLLFHVKHLATECQSWGRIPFPSSGDEAGGPTTELFHVEQSCGSSLFHVSSVPWTPCPQDPRALPGEVKTTARKASFFEEFQLLKANRSWGNAWPCAIRSEERRVGKEGRSRWSPYHLKKKK